MSDDCALCGCDIDDHDLDTLLCLNHPECAGHEPMERYEEDNDEN